ncbi:WecB/TagA/CpsF family glycosyltransferase [Rhodococcoides fascians]|uniref:WecB/TagA/CpsF family glycosyltransferase n=1 Tax=Rhodococcoides fascians TaxID=1828 RepID=UPI001E60AEA0|nr:WecB/TagA/CpsF family glycosyltransferase [Rhodococcus fascians]
MALAAKDENYSRLLNSHGVNFPDGTPVVWFMRLRDRRSNAKQVRGPSLFVESLRTTQDTDVRHFFLGTTELTLAKLIEAVDSKYPGVNIAGSYSPPFAPLSPELTGACTKEIQNTNATLVWVALGTPKQDFLARDLSTQTGLPCVAVGAAFDFVAGTVKEAPSWVQNTGLEWLYRFATEPRRLWRRYLIGNFQFVWSAITEITRTPSAKTMS